MQWRLDEGMIFFQPPIKNNLFYYIDSIHYIFNLENCLDIEVKNRWEPHQVPDQNLKHFFSLDFWHMQKQCRDFGLSAQRLPFLTNVPCARIRGGSALHIVGSPLASQFFIYFSGARYPGPGARCSHPPGWPYRRTAEVVMALVIEVRFYCLTAARGRGGTSTIYLYNWLSGPIAGAHPVSI